jgi:Family of unknown function (DUF5681)
MTHKTPSHPRHDQHVGDAGERPNHHSADPQAIAPGASDTPTDGQGRERGTYTVGYCRPPVHSRFKPGQSGNPKGRAKGSLNLRTILKQVSNEQILIREGDRPRRMSRMEALVRTTYTRAFKGDPKALASLILLWRQIGLTESDETTTELLQGPEYAAIVAGFLARHGVEHAPSDDVVDAAASPRATSAKQEG